jgi:hypothetical protein
MRLRAGNRAIAEHSALGKGLLLFRKTSEGLRFEGRERVITLSVHGIGQALNARQSSLS